MTIQVDKTRPREVKRRLTAILSADVKGYSRLMGTDEEGTLRTLTSYREAMATFIQQHQGRVVNAPGDALLAQFESVVDALKSAVEIQGELSKRNAELPADRRMEYRIGINLGDVMVDGEAIYGDGVNIAARLESLADAGGICISRSAFDQVRNKLELGYEYLGEQSVKNIVLPVRVYKVLMEPEAAGKVIGEKKVEPRQRKRVVLSLGVILILIVAAVVAYINLRPYAHRVEVASKDKMAFPLPDKPSIAVLPFVNMSGDKEQEYFSDGMTEELISALSKLGGLKVISRTSAFYFKGGKVDLRTIGQKLGVEYVLEGSVRKSGNHLRITAQLIKVTDDVHLWSETYDRKMQEVFAIQDDISRAVVDSLRVKLLGKKGTPLVSAPTKNMEAYNLYLKGRQFVYLGGKPALECFKKAVEIDPGYAAAYAGIAQYYVWVPILGAAGPSREEVYVRAIQAAQKALELDSNFAEVHAYLGTIQMMYEWDWKTAEQSLRKAVALNPGSADSHAYYSMLLYDTGRFDKAIAESKIAVELDPYSAEANRHLGQSLCYARKYDQAIVQLNRTLEMFPNHTPSRLVLGSAYIAKGMFAEAIALYQQGVSDFPTNAILLGNLAFAYGLAGKKDEARQILDKMLEASKTRYVPATPIAKIYVALGDMDKAFEYLGKAYATREVSGFFHIKAMPDFDLLRSDPRFDTLLKKMGLAE